MTINTVIAEREGAAVHLTKEHKLCFMAKDEHEADLAVQALNSVAIDQRKLIHDMAIQWVEKYKSEKCEIHAQVLTDFALVIRILDENERPPCGL